MLALLLAALLLLLPAPARAASLFQHPLPDGAWKYGCRFDVDCNPQKPGFFHSGQDYYPADDTTALEVRATADGTVAGLFHAEDYPSHGMGNALIMRHLLRSGGEVFSLYGHLDHFARAFALGDEVRRGQALGVMGHSGFGSQYYWNLHLHFEIKSGAVLGDPEGGGYEGNTPTPAEDWGYFDPAAYIGQVEFVPLDGGGEPPTFEGLPGEVEVEEGHRLEVEVHASGGAAISAQGEWPANCRLEGGAGGSATIVFWPDFDQGEAGGRTYGLGLTATNDQGSTSAELVCVVRDVPQVSLFAGSVGEGGGMVSGGGDSVTVEFRAGSLGSGMRGRAGTAEASLFPSLPEHHFGPVVVVGPPGYHYGQPVRVTFRWEGSAPQGEVAVWAFDLNTGKWGAALTVEGLKQEDDQQRLSFETSQAGLFAAGTGDPPAGSSGGGGGCFIATAAWGSAGSPQVRLLRRVRDECLAASSCGRRLTLCYYRFSPPPARFLAPRPLLRALVRASLWPLCWAAGAWLRLGAWLCWLAMLGVGWLAALGRLPARRRAP